MEVGLGQVFSINQIEKVGSIINSQQYYSILHIYDKQMETSTSKPST